MVESRVPVRKRSDTAPALAPEQQSVIHEFRLAVERFQAEAVDTIFPSGIRSTFLEPRYGESARISSYVVSFNPYHANVVVGLGGSSASFMTSSDTLSVHERALLHVLQQYGISVQDNTRLLYSGTPEYREVGMFDNAIEPNPFFEDLKTIDHLEVRPLSETFDRWDEMDRQAVDMVKQARAELQSRSPNLG